MKHSWVVQIIRLWCIDTPFFCDYTIIFLTVSLPSSPCYLLLFPLLQHQHHDTPLRQCFPLTTATLTSPTTIAASTLSLSGWVVKVRTYWDFYREKRMETNMANLSNKGMEKYHHHQQHSPLSMNNEKDGSYQ